MNSMYKIKELYNKSQDTFIEKKLLEKQDRGAIK